jgi:hypothetical protein
VNDSNTDAPHVDSIRSGRRSHFFTPVPEWVILAGLSPQALALYVALLAHVNHQRGDGVAWPGMATLAELLGFRTRKSVARYVAELAAVGAVDVDRQRGSMVRRNVYVVHETAPEGHTGALSLAAFYEAKRARRGTPVPLATDTPVGVATGTAVGMKETNATRRTNADEDAARGDTSGGDAYAAAGQRTSSPTQIDQARAKRKPITIRTPRGFLDAYLEDGEVQRQLLACSIAALTRAGFEITDAGKQKLLDGIHGTMQNTDRRTMIRHLQGTLELVGGEDPYWGSIAVRKHRRAS